jgi:hypothetical protein
MLGILIHVSIPTITSSSTTGSIHLFIGHFLFLLLFLGGFLEHLGKHVLMDVELVGEFQFVINLLIPKCLIVNL